MDATSSNSKTITAKATVVPARPTVANARATQPLSARIRRKTAIVGRWLHIYLSMVAFAITLFFAVTGYTSAEFDYRQI